MVEVRRRYGFDQDSNPSHHSRGGKRLERLVVFLDLRLHAFEREVHSSCVRKEPV